MKVSGWSRRLRIRVEALAESRRAAYWLFAIALAEASVFPIPPDVLLLPLAGAAPRRAWRLAAICTVGSLLGAVVGWLIGYLLYDMVGRPILSFYGVTEQAEAVLTKYDENAVLAIAVAGFTPIPFKVFTILAGMKATVALPTLVGASLLGRGGRFGLVAGVAAFAGPRVAPIVERHFNLFAVVFVVLLIGGFLVVRVFIQ